MIGATGHPRLHDPLPIVVVARKGCVVFERALTRQSMPMDRGAQLAASTSGELPYDRDDRARTRGWASESDERGRDAAPLLVPPRFKKLKYGA